jgi:hypothetical protein
MPAGKPSIRPLTHMQETFCLHYVEHGDGTRAHREAGYAPTANDNTRWKRVCEMLKMPAIMARIEELRAPAAQQAAVNLVSHIASLRYLREIAVSRGQTAAAIRAEELMGKVVGLYIERVAVQADIKVDEVRHDLTQLSADELRAMYAMLLKTGVNADTKALR